MKKNLVILFITLIIIFSSTVITPTTPVHAIPHVMPWRWDTSPNIKYTYVNLTSTDAQDANIAIPNVRDAPANFNYNSGTGDVYYYSVNRPDMPNTCGWFDPTQHDATTIYQGKVYINNYLTNPMPRSGRQNIIAHETCHALMLDENYEIQYCLMYPSYSTTYLTYKIFVPLYEDINNLQYVYDIKSFTYKSTSYIYKTANGHVTGGTSSEGYPEHIWISPAGSGNIPRRSPLKEVFHLPERFT